VATRRLRSDLRTFGPLLDPEWATGLELDLKWLADDLGKIRDADVLLARFRATISDHPELDPVGARNIVKALEQQRRRDNTTLLGHLARKRADQLFDRLVDAATDPMTAPQADDPAVEKLPKLVRKRWRRLERTVEALDAEPPVDDLHRVRILAKRTRYAAEAVVPVFGPEAKALAKPVAKIQDVLGELNDAEVAETWLAAMVETADGPTAFAAGRLAQIAGSEADSSRHDWQKHYRRAADKKRQAWLR
jgi:CHAD domain-containing protein